MVFQSGEPLLTEFQTKLGIILPQFTIKEVVNFENLVYIKMCKNYFVSIS